MTSPGVRFPPPLLFVGGLGGAALLQSRLPVPLWRSGPPMVLLPVAAALIAAGAAWILWGLVTFHRARTAILPNQPASNLVTHGPYRFGRNPMYVGMSSIYWGGTLWMNSGWPIAIFPIVIVLLLALVIRREERYLAHTFGKEYRQYCLDVSRWLSPRGPRTPR